MEPYKIVMISIFTLFFIAGCASLKERESFDDLAKVETQNTIYKNQLFTTRPSSRACSEPACPEPACLEPVEKVERSKDRRAEGSPCSSNLPELDEGATLADYLAYAALNNPGLKSAFNRWKAALEKVPQVRSLPDPKFNYAYYIRNVETRVGPQRHKFGISQMFPWFGKLDLKGDKALEAANADRERYETAKLKLFYKVKNVYYEYYYLARAIAITNENLQLLTYIESVARIRYKAGKAPYAVIIKAQVELGKMEDHLSTLNELREPLTAVINAALNRPSDKPLPWPDDIPKDDISISDEELFTRLKENNPELKSIEFTAAKEKTAIDLAKRSYYPDIVVGVNYIETGDALMSNTEESGKDPIMAMFSINLPLWYGKYHASEREAKARYNAALQNRSDRENNLVADLQMSLFKFRDAERKIDLYRDTLIPKAEQSLNVTQQAFEAVKADFLDLIDAQRTLLQFRLSYERALANRAQRLAEIEMLVGKEVGGGWMIKN